MLAAGIDVGSVAAKGIVLESDGRGAVRMLGRAVMPTGWNSAEAGEKVLAAVLAGAGREAAALSCIVGTGYGRISLPFADKTVTEVSCHARGAAYLFPLTGIVLDIGGQDSKVISLETGNAPGNGRRGKAGAVRDFIMNDKCAAGTGRFLQVLSGILDLPLDELGRAAARGRPAAISSMCAVFAESEIVGLLAGGTPPQDVAAGVFLSIVRRTCGLARRIPMHGQCTFSGGLARSPAFGEMLARELAVPVNIPDDPQTMGALGAALIASDLAARKHAQRGGP